MGAQARKGGREGRREGGRLVKPFTSYTLSTENQNPELQVLVV
jgi:hypothetical protein